MRQKRPQGNKKNNEDQALGRSRGGFSTKIHAVVDVTGVPLSFTLTGGQQNDITQAESVLEKVSIPNQIGRPRKRCHYLAADKGYDALSFRQYCDKHKIIPVIPYRRNRINKPGRPRKFHSSIYKQRNVVERFFGKIKEMRRIATRYDKLAKSYAAMVMLACSIICFRRYFSYAA